MTKTKLRQAMGERLEKEMPNAWVYSITGQVITAADGNIYEGSGIPPDIAVLNTTAELANGVDIVRFFKSIFAARIATSKQALIIAAALPSLRALLY